MEKIKKQADPYFLKHSFWDSGQNGIIINYNTMSYIVIKKIFPIRGPERGYFFSIPVLTRNHSQTNT
jgi:hypothetical protein